MDRIAQKDKCTGCAACSFVCPKSCIKMTEQGFNGLLPVLNLDNCINCGRCTLVCPVKTPMRKQSQIHGTQMSICVVNALQAVQHLLCIRKRFDKVGA